MFSMVLVMVLASLFSGCTSSKTVDEKQDATAYSDTADVVGSDIALSQDVTSTDVPAQDVPDASTLTDAAGGKG